MPAPTLTKSAPARLALTIKVKSFDGASGTFTGYLSTFGNEDLVRDVVEAGAFTKTLADAEAKRAADGSPYLFPILWQHNPTEPIGGFTTMTEDEHGLYVEGALDMDIEQGRRAFSGLSKGYIRSLSIGYDVIRERWAKALRYLVEIRLWEGSVVTIPANPAATVGDVKGRSSMTRTRRQRHAKPVEGQATKARDFLTVFATEAEAEDLLEDLDDLGEALCMTLVGILMDTTGSGEAPEAQARTSLGQFAEKVVEWLARASQADVWADMVASQAEMAESMTEYATDPPHYYGSYMSAQDEILGKLADVRAAKILARYPETKAGRALSQANTDRITKALDTAEAGHSQMADAIKDMRGLVSDLAPSRNDPDTQDDDTTKPGESSQPDKKAAPPTETPEASTSEHASALDAATLDSLRALSERITNALGSRA
jgi:HK97 family phage prohead protease